MGRCDESEITNMEPYTTIDTYHESPAERDARREEHEEMKQRLQAGDQVDRLEEEIKVLEQKLDIIDASRVGCDACNLHMCAEHSRIMSEIINDIDDRKKLIQEINEFNNGR